MPLKCKHLLRYIGKTVFHVRNGFNLLGGALLKISYSFYFDRNQPTNFFVSKIIMPLSSNERFALNHNA